MYRQKHTMPRNWQRNFQLNFLFGFIKITVVHQLLPIAMHTSDTLLYNCTAVLSSNMKTTLFHLSISQLLN